MATAAGNIGPPPIIPLGSPLHPPPQQPLSPIAQQTQTSPTTSTAVVSAIPIGSGVTVSGAGGLRESQAPNPGDLSGIFSVVLNRQHQQNHHPLSHHHVRWPSFSMGNRSFWTKYCLLCTVCGSAATILAGIFLVVAALFRYYTTSIYYFETVPTYIPAILLSICGVSTIAFSCKRNRNIILLRITACWSLCSAALSSVITITTSLIHMNRLQTLKECVYTKTPPSCTCYSHSFGMQGPAGPETTHYLFENTPDCDVIHGILYSCLRAVFAISVVAVLLSIFLCMLLYQLIGHERKKAYWSRIRRINSDWSADFIACLARPMPRERSSLLPLMPSLMPAAGSMPMHGPSILPPPGWGPPPSYDDACGGGDGDRSGRHISGPRNGLCGSSIQPTHSFAGTSSGGFTGGGFFNNRSSASFAFHGGHHAPPRRLRLVTSHSENSFRSNPDGLMCPHPFSPTITVDPVSIFKQHVHVNQHHHNNTLNNHPSFHHHPNHRHNPSGNNCTAGTVSNCSIAHNPDYLVGNNGDSPPIGNSSNPGRNYRSLSQSQVLQHSTEDDDCCLNHSCHGTHHHHNGQIPQSASFLTTASGRNSEFSITSLSIPDNSSMSITMKSSNDIPLNDTTSSSHCCNINHPSSLAEDDDFAALSSNHIEETGFSDQEISLTSSTNYTASVEMIRQHRRPNAGGTGEDNLVGGGAITSSSSGAIGLTSIGGGGGGAPGKKSVHHSNAPCATTSASEPKMINANKTNSFSAVVGQTDSNNVINSDTDIILNKKALEFWGSLKKHKNFAYYGGGGNSTSRRRRKDKNKSSLSKISSLPSSPFMNMRRKLFGSGGGKSLECVENLNYNYSYSIPPLEVADLLVSSNSNFSGNANAANNNAGHSDDVQSDVYGGGNSEDEEKCSGKGDQSRNVAETSCSKSSNDKQISTSADGCTTIAQVRP